MYSMSQIINQVNHFTTNKNDMIQIFKSLDNIVLDATLTLNNEGLMCRTMDPSHVSLIDISMDKVDFEKFNIDNEQQITINVKEFLKILKELDNNSIDVNIKKDTIELNQNGFNYKINKIESVDYTDPPLPKIPYNAEIQLNGISNNEVKKIFKKIAAISDYVTFEADDDKIVFSGSGNNGKSEIELNKTKALIFLNENSAATYSLEYINPFLKSVTKDTKVKFQFSDTKPLRIETSLGVQSRIHFYIAPRVEN